MALLTNLVAYWKMDESSGNPTDSSGGGFTLTNNASVSFNAGLINNGADTGTNLTSSYFNISNDLGITGGATTISLWVKLNTEIPSGQYRFAFQFDSSTQVAYRMRYEFNGGTRRVGFNRGREGIVDDIAYTATGDLGTSSWYHMVLTYDGSTVLGYVNNSVNAGASSSGDGSGSETGNFFGLFSNFNLSGGTANDGINEFFVPAHIDEVGVWSRALSGSEVSQLYNGGVGLQYPFTGGHNLSFRSNNLRPRIFGPGLAR